MDECSGICFASFGLVVIAATAGLGSALFAVTAVGLAVGAGAALMGSKAKATQRKPEKPRFSLPTRSIDLDQIECVDCGHLNLSRHWLCQKCYSDLRLNCVNCGGINPKNAAQCKQCRKSL